MTNFNFYEPRVESTDFAFGAKSSLIEGSWKAEIAPDASLQAQQGHAGDLSADIHGLSSSFTGLYDKDVWRGKSIKTCLCSEDATSTYTKIQGEWQVRAVSSLYKKGIVWQNGKKIKVEKLSILSDLSSYRDLFCILAGEGTPVFTEKIGSADSATPFRDFYTLLATEATRTQGHIFTLNYVSAWPRRIFRECFSEKGSTSVTTMCGVFKTKSATVQSPFCFPWDKARHPEFIWPVPITIPSIPDGFHASTDLHIQCVLPDPIWSPISFNIGLANICAQVLRPLTFAQVIIVTHDLWIKLLSDSTMIPCLSANLEIDRDSWGWKWNAALAERQDSLIETQQEVEISIDNHTWKGIVESYKGTRELGNRAYSIGGRSLAAELTSPYAAARSRNETSNSTFMQLVEAEVAATGWTIIWNTVTDWSVPANTLSYSNLTPMAAIMHLAETVGCIVQAHTSDKTITISPKYMEAPWNLDSYTPDISLPLTPILSEGVAWVPKPLMNGVWVSGTTTTGKRVKVKRTGTDASPSAEMVVNPLITAEVAAIQRGRQVLSATGKRRNVDLQMPVLPEIGILAPGQVIEVLDTIAWKGYIDSVKINASMTGGVYQSISIEHVTEVF